MPRVRLIRGGLTQGDWERAALQGNTAPCVRLASVWQRALLANEERYYSQPIGPRLTYRRLV